MSTSKPALCVSGLFIGIDNYGRFQPTKALFCATSDAKRLESYFRAALPTGIWTPITNSDRLFVSRITILDELLRWIRSVKAGQAGLFYFAGHGQLTERGLVLAGQDFHDYLPYESGVPVETIVELITREGNRKSRYVLMLDCCRGYSDELGFDKATSNITILYACSPGEPAVELQDSGGLFVEALLNRMHKADGDIIDGTIFCSLRNIFEGLESEMQKGFAEQIQIPEHFGAPSSRILLPKVKTRIRDSFYDRGDAPRVIVRSSPLLPDLLSDRQRRVEEETVRYCAGTLRNITAALDICRQVGQRQIEVSFNFIDHRFDIPAFFEFLINKTNDVFTELEILWNRPISDAEIFELAKTHNVKVEIDQTRTVTRTVIWEVGKNVYGSIAFDTWWDHGSRASVRCGPLSNAGTKYPLVHLMPALSSMFRSIVGWQTENITAEKSTNKLQAFTDTFEASDLSPDFIEYCRFVEAAFLAGVNPIGARFRSLGKLNGGARLGRAIIQEFWRLFCTKDRAYASVRASSKRVNNTVIAAIAGYIAATFSLDAAFATAVVTAIAMVIAKVGINTLCNVIGDDGHQR